MYNMKRLRRAFPLLFADASLGSMPGGRLERNDSYMRQSCEQDTFDTALRSIGSYSRFCGGLLLWVF